MSNPAYAKIADIVKKHSGINIEPEKYYLFDSRLETLMSDYSVKDAASLLQKIETDNNPKMIANLVEVMTTHESLFFRDIKVFDALKGIIIPSILQSKADNKNMKIWSAACSSGQEIYSVMIQLLETPSLKDFKFEIVASDISDKIILKAKQAEYSQFEVQRGMPISYLMKYFDNVGEIWKLHENLKQNITFKQHNLISPADAIGKDFDLVMARNVLIYFDKATKAAVFNNIHKTMRKGGYLCLGTAENNFGCESLFEAVPGALCWYKAI